MVFDDYRYSITMYDVNIYIKHMFNWDDKLGIYFPISYASDFWLMGKNLVEMNDTTPLENTTITMRAGTIPVSYV